MGFQLFGLFSDKIKFYARALTCFVSVVLCASYGVFASLALVIVGRGSISQWTTGRAFSSLLSPLIGFYFEVENEERLQTRPAIFISNHQT